MKDPNDNIDLVNDVWKGMAKATLRGAYMQHSTSKVTVCRKPETKVLANAAFKDGAFVLVGLTPSVTIVSDTSKVEDYMMIGPLFEDGGKEHFAALRPCLAFPQKVSPGAQPSKVADPMLVPFWAVRQSLSPVEASCTRETIDVKIVVVGRATTLSVPIIRSTKALKAGEEVVVLKKHDKRGLDQAENNEQAQKKAKTAKAAPQGAAGKGKGKKAGRTGKA